MQSSNGHEAERQFVVIGAGPAGLTAAYELTKHHYRPLVLEKLDKPGGIARTEKYRGYHFDMGGHRFFTKSAEVSRLWREVMGPEFLRRPRLSRIYYRGRFFHYPLKPLNALLGLGLIEGLLIMLSYIRWKLFPYRRVDTFEQWVTNRFGKRLFQTFFKTYTEKVWGISCSVLKAEWAAQRIKNLSLRSALISMFVKPGQNITTLIEEFDYPRLGPGMMWSAFKERVEQRGGAVQLDTDVIRVHRDGDRIVSVVVCHDGVETTIPGTDFISSMPITEFVKKLHPPAPPEVLHAAAHLNYRDFLTVCLIINKADLFQDNWIYIHDPQVKVGRIQNFKNWSPDMVPDASKSSLGLEYFCNEGDDLWTTPDDELIELAKREVARVGLAKYADIEDGCVVRVPKSYPVYDSDYREHLAVLRDYVDRFQNFQTIGRNGLHRYNNQDHAMLTGLLAVRNLVHGEKNDLWSVNAEQEYHEEIRTGAKEEKLVVAVEEALSLAFQKVDSVALGMSLGLVAGLGLFLATLVLVLKGGEVVGPNLQLLSNFFPGYTVTLPGSLLGLAYGFASGYLTGWGFALLRNLSVLFYMASVQRRAWGAVTRNLLDYI